MRYALIIELHHHGITSSFSVTLTVTRNEDREGSRCLNIRTTLLRLCFCCVAIWNLMLSGCTVTESNIDPKALFHRVMHRLSTEHIAVQWKDSGLMINHNKNSMNWNPLADVESIEQSVEVITMDQQQSDHLFVVLSVILNHQAAKNMLVDQLHSQMNNIRKEVLLKNDDSIDNQLSQAEKKRMNNEIELYIKEADRQLLELLNTSRVHSVMMLRVERNTAKLTQVELNTTIDYMSNGQSVREMLTDTFLIS
jgi:hypothetical protein